MLKLFTNLFILAYQQTFPNTYTYVYVCVRIYICMLHIYICVCVCIWVVCVYICVPMHMWKFIYTYVYICIYIYIYIYIYVNAFMCCMGVLFCSLILEKLWFTWSESLFEMHNAKVPISVFFLLQPLLFILWNTAHYLVEVDVYFS